MCPCRITSRLRRGVGRWTLATGENLGRPNFPPVAKRTGLVSRVYEYVTNYMIGYKYMRLRGARE